MRFEDAFQQAWPAFVLVTGLLLVGLVAHSDGLFARAGAIAAADCNPFADGRGPVDYKRHLAGVLSTRALRRAAARALAQEA